MLVLAKSAAGREFLYVGESAHKVAKKDAEKIAAILNDIRYDLKEGQIWYPHTIDEYDPAWIYASDYKQAFTLTKAGALKERRAPRIYW